MPPAIAVATAVGRIKGGSARAVNDLVSRGEFGWQAEYGVVSFAERHLPNVVAYVNDQPRRHATRDLWDLLERVDPDGTEPGAT
ncbi:MAG: transposase [Sphaerobacter sp.]|nr:transposase [Sphaerobacter sp.]